jgi:hypothetical protein
MLHSAIDGGRNTIGPRVMRTAISGTKMSPPQNWGSKVTLDACAQPAAKLAALLEPPFRHFVPHTWFCCLLQYRIEGLPVKLPTHLRVTSFAQQR